MKKLFLIPFSLAILLCMETKAQNPTGIYIKNLFGGKVIDSLIINSDSTFKLVFYYPEFNAREYIAGKWKVKNGKLLFIGYHQKPYAKFKLITDNSGEVQKIKVINGTANLRRWHKLDKQ